jgi:hypothetical protein
MGHRTLTLARDRATDEERKHTVGVDPPKVPGVEERALFPASGDFVQKRIDRLAIE